MKFEVQGTNLLVVEQCCGGEAGVNGLGVIYAVMGPFHFQRPLSCTRYTIDIGHHGFMFTIMLPFSLRKQHNNALQSNHLLVFHATGTSFL